MCRCDSGRTGTRGSAARTEPVEYALAHSACSVLMARYLTELPDKALLEAKLEELYALATEEQTE